MNNDEKKIIKMYTEDKIGCHRIGKQFRLSCNQVARILTKHSIPLRTKAEGQRLRSENTTKYSNVDFFKTIDTEEKAYWLGFIMADGCVIVNKVYSRLAIGLKLSDRPHLEKINKIFNGTVSEYQGKAHFYVNNVALCEDLIKLGIVPDKTHKDDFNEVFDKLPNELKRHYLRGLFDGDGTIYYQERQRSMACGFIATTMFSKQIEEHLRKILGVREVKIQDKNHYSTFAYKSKHDVLAILSYMYDDSTVYLDRKYNKFRDNINFLKYLKPSNQHLVS